MIVESVLLRHKACLYYTTIEFVQISCNIKICRHDMEQLSSKLILPPLPLKNQSSKQVNVKGVFSALNRKKQQFQSCLFQQQENDGEYSLQYSHNLNPCNVYEALPERTQARSRLEYYSQLKNSRIEKLQQRKLKTHHLVESQINIKIVPIKTTKQQSVMTQTILEQLKEQKPQLKVRFNSEEVEVTHKKQSSFPKQKDMPLFQPTIRPVVGRSLSKNDCDLEIPHFQPTIRPVASRSLSKNNQDLEIPRMQSPVRKISVKSLVQIMRDLKHNKTNERLQRSAKILQMLNPFFSKVQRVIAICLLRVGTILLKQARCTLYEMDEPYTSFYIILTGKVKLIGRDGMHKICDAGEVLLEEIIIPQDKSHQQAVALQGAKVIEEAYLVEIERKQLFKLEKELVHYGFKQGLLQLQFLFKRNSIAKNWLRNKFRLLQQM